MVFLSLGKRSLLKKPKRARLSCKCVLTPQNIEGRVVSILIDFDGLPYQDLQPLEALAQDLTQGIEGLDPQRKPQFPIQKLTIFLY